MLIDKKGRVAARVGADESDFGDVVAGRPLVDDALAGYLRDDIWVMGNALYFVAASPVVKRDAPPEYVGAVVLGHQLTNDLAKKLVSSLDVQIGFYLNDNTIAGSDQTALDQATMASAVTSLTDPDIAKDCPSNKPLSLRAGADDYDAIVARLPGEAATRKAFYTVFIKPPAELGALGTLKVVTKDDLGVGNFPWFLVAGLFLIALGGAAAIGVPLLGFVGFGRDARATGDRAEHACADTSSGAAERATADPAAGCDIPDARAVHLAESAADATRRRHPRRLGRAAGQR